MESIGKPSEGRYDDVYYDPGNGEFQPLSAGLAEFVSHEVERVMSANYYYEHDYQQLGFDSWMLTAECVMTDVVPGGAESGDVLREMKLTSHELHRGQDDTDQIQTIVLAERQHASRVLLEMATESVGDLSDQYVTAWSEDRYIIERTNGVYHAYVEQIDMLTAAGDRQKRPMTLYDAAELIMQIEQLRIV